MQQDGSLPKYSQPGTHLGGQSFHLEDFQFPPALKPGPAKRMGTYSWWQVGTAYVVPFVFDPLVKHRLRVFLPARDRDQWWMFGDEVEAGERVGSMLVQCLGDQAGLTVEDAQRTRFLDLHRVWDLTRLVTIDDDKPPVARHELARVFGFAMMPDEMADVRITESDDDPAGRWIDILSETGLELAKTEMDPALQDILARLTSRVLKFHNIRHG